MAASAVCVVSGATPAHRSSSTVVSNPSVAASRAVARTQWSVAIPQMSTWVTSWARSQSASGWPSCAALEAGVRRLVLALEEDRVEGLRVEVGVEGLALGPDPAVHRPGVHEVRLPGPVVAGVDVVVLGGDDVVVRRRVGPARASLVQQPADVRGYLGAAGDGQGPALAEVVLDVDDDQRGLHVFNLARAVREARR